MTLSKKEYLDGEEKVGETTSKDKPLLIIQTGTGKNVTKLLELGVSKWGDTEVWNLGKHGLLTFLKELNKFGKLNSGGRLKSGDFIQAKPGNPFFEGCEHLYVDGPTLEPISSGHLGGKTESFFLKDKRFVYFYSQWKGLLAISPSPEAFTLRKDGFYDDGHTIYDQTGRMVVIPEGKTIKDFRYLGYGRFSFDDKKQALSEFYTYDKETGKVTYRNYDSWGGRSVLEGVDVSNFRLVDSVSDSSHYTTALHTDGKYDYCGGNRVEYVSAVNGTLIRRIHSVAGHGRIDEYIKEHDLERLLVTGIVSRDIVLDDPRMKARIAKLEEEKKELTTRLQTVNGELDLFKK